MAIFGQQPPRGWTVAGGRLEEISTIAGYASRRCNVVGRCQRQDCRRSCHFDYERLLKNGMADLDAKKVMATFRCSRLDGCSLEFREKPQRVITLGDLAGRDYVGVEIRCTACGDKRITTVEALLYRLKKADKGNEATSVRNVATLLQGACAKCKAGRWEVTFPWYDPTRGQIPFWKQDLQKRIDEARRRRDVERGLVT